MTTSTGAHVDELREWARGDLTLEAATELLIRGGFADRGWPWIQYDELARRPWVDFTSIPERIGAKSGGEQRFLRLIASLGADVPVIVGDEVTGLDREHVQLVLAAIAHAAGMSTPGRTIEQDADGIPRFVNTTPIYTWPALVEGGE